MMEMHIASFHLRNVDNEFLFLLSCPATIRAVHQGKNESSTLLSYEGGGGILWLRFLRPGVLDNHHSTFVGHLLEKLHEQR